MVTNCELERTRRPRTPDWISRIVFVFAQKYVFWCNFIMNGPG